MSRLRFDCRHHLGGFRLAAAFAAGDGVTGLFGPSGSGKSTIFGLIAGILKPATGHIVLGDRTLLDTGTGVCLPPEQRRIGVVFQDHLLFPHLTIRKNLLYGRQAGREPRISLERVAAVLEIEGLLDRWPHTLSGGQRQRVALGRALLRGPELLLMDEPLTALDEGLKERVLTYLERALAEWRIPTIFVSHDQADVRRLAEQVIVIESGKVIAAGPTAATLDRAALTSLTQRPGLVNLLRVTDLHHTEDHWNGRIGEQVVRLPAGSAPETTGVIYVQLAPQDVVLGSESVVGISSRNHLRGQVRELVALPDRTFVAIDIGQLLWAEVTPEAARELSLQPGSAITCHIKTSALQLLS